MFCTRGDWRKENVPYFETSRNYCILFITSNWDSLSKPKQRVQLLMLMILFILKPTCFDFLKSSSGLIIT